MDSNRLWSPAFINYGISSGILYMTQYVLVAALPIVITSELSGSDLDAGLAMTYFQIGTIVCRLFAGRLMALINELYYYYQLLYFSSLWGSLILQPL